MRRIGSLIMCIAVCLVALAGCSSAGDNVAQTTWEKDFSSQTQTSETSGQEAANPQEDAAAQSSTVSVGNRLPYVGMSGDLIDATWLGPASGVGDKTEGGKFAGSTPYYWRAQNGTNDLVFSAYVKDGEVVMVAKFNTSKNYWGSAGGSSVLSRELPDLYASGETVEKDASAAQDGKPDADGWDDPDDYAKANADAFDSYDAAYDYWLEEMSE